MRLLHVRLQHGRLLRQHGVGLGEHPVLLLQRIKLVGQSATPSPTATAADAARAAASSTAAAAATIERHFHVVLEIRPQRLVFLH